jgi:hypothetical protein
MCRLLEEQGNSKLHTAQLLYMLVPFSGTLRMRIQKQHTTSHLWAEESKHCESGNASVRGCVNHTSVLRGMLRAAMHTT